MAYANSLFVKQVCSELAGSRAALVEEGSLAGWRMEMRAASLPDKSGKKATRM
jgi:hypothetical protein